MITTILILIINVIKRDLLKNVNAQMGIIFWIVVKVIIVFHFKFSITENTHGWNGMDPIFNMKAIERIINCSVFISNLFIS